MKRQSSKKNENKVCPVEKAIRLRRWIQEQVQRVQDEQRENPFTPVPGAQTAVVLVQLEDKLGLIHGKPLAITETSEESTENTTRTQTHSSFTTDIHNVPTEIITESLSAECHLDL